MPIGIEKLHPLFAAEITGVDLTRPLPQDEAEEIKAAFAKHAVLLFRDQPIDDDQQVAFSELFGPLIPRTNYHRPGEKWRLGNYMSDVSNIDYDGTMLAEDSGRKLHSRANQLWHTDASFKHIPARASLLSAHEVPPVGGNTAFADMRAAYDALPDARKAELEDLIAEHSIFHSRAKLGHTDYNEEAHAEVPPVKQVLIRKHPVTGRKSLYIASHISRIIGMDDDAAQALVEELIAFATQDKFVYEHAWTVGDLIIWDNRYTMHRAVGYDDMNHRRDMRRTTVSDELNSIDLKREMENRAA
jgi:alpha-ketoglutarate-dependent 2,4-dichlorophenoxyacetate dioxygenase